MKIIHTKLRSTASSTPWGDVTIDEEGNVNIKDLSEEALDPIKGLLSVPGYEDADTSVSAKKERDKDYIKVLRAAREAGISPQELQTLVDQKAAERKAAEAKAKK